MGKPTENTETPWIRVTQLDATGHHRADHLIEYLFQFDCYAGAPGGPSGAAGRPQASLLARTVRAALVEMPERETDPGAVVTAVNIVGHAYVPDIDVDDPGRDRYAITAAIWLHA